MKLTPHKFKWNCSRAATHGPASRPSTLSKVLPRFFSVVILNIDSVLVVACRCMIVTIRCKYLIILKCNKSKDLRQIPCGGAPLYMTVYVHYIKCGLYMCDHIWSYSLWLDAKQHSLFLP